MSSFALTKVVPALVAAAIGLGSLMTIGAPSAHASEKSDCDAKGGTYTETKIFDQTTGKSGTNYRCCVKDTATNTTTCTSTTVTDSRIPVSVRPGVIGSVETLEPAQPVQRVPVYVLDSGAQIQQSP
jgi:hypothetical protein